MKVDIITRHSVPNYGSLLQSYATQKVIEDMGFETEIINYTRYDERYKNLVNSLIKGKKWNKNFIMRLFYKVIQTPNYARMYKKFENFRNSFLKETLREYGSIEELKKNPPIADVYCSGSDQIWGKIGTADYDEAYFLQFVNDRNKKCIAYSSSFGKKDIDEILKNKLNELLKNYKEIMVREDTAKKILNEHGFENVKQVLDPTFLLDREKWSELANKAKKKYNGYILVYQLHDNKEFDRYAKQFSKKTGLKLLRVSPSIYHIIRSGKLIYLPNQYDFLALFKNAEYILTDSFHATVFSIIFNKKFVDILPGNTSTRIISILELVGLNDRILKNYTDFSFIDKKINFEECNKIIKKEREKSIELLKKAIIDGSENTIDMLNKHYRCTGCRMCKQICPVKAINMIENEEGFYEPTIDKERCIKCGLCYKKCPQLNHAMINQKLEKQMIFATKNKDIKEQRTSSSGGIFSALAKIILNSNGVIYGASFNENLELEHIRINDIKDLYKLKGSKYIQSNVQDTFKLVKNDLNNNKQVLYVGTPCQIGGLRNFLSKEYDNLILVDLVCHGVPSQKLFNQYIKCLEKINRSKVINYEFRNKEKAIWELGYIPKVQFKNNTNKYLYGDTDIYIQSFLKGNTLMEACYNCQYTNLERIADITIGDLWGTNKIYPELYDEKGISLLLVNTKKGKKIFDKIKDELYIKDIKLDKIIKYMQPLREPSKRPQNRDYSIFNLFQYFKKNRISNVLSIKKYIPISIRKKIKRIS